MEWAVVAEGLRKRYGAKEALAGLDLAVPDGSVVALLGPNGAGKTTAVRILATLARPDGGHARVAGFDVVRDAPAVRASIGLVGQQAAVDEILSGRQNLELFGRLCHLGARAARARADELLARFDLRDAGDRPVKTYSGGMRRRLDLAAGLILAPRVLFLDEPTVGLDPRSRNEVWATVRGLVAAGTTVLLTTQYLDEADRLADAICLIDAGRAVATGTPDALKDAIGGDRIDVVVRHPEELDAAARLLETIAQAPPDRDLDRRRLSAPVGDRMVALAAAVRALANAGIAADDLSVRRPTLDEVFLRLTGPQPAALEERSETGVAA